MREKITKLKTQREEKKTLASRSTTEILLTIKIEMRYCFSRKFNFKSAQFLTRYECGAKEEKNSKIWQSLFEKIFSSSASSFVHMVSHLPIRYISCSDYCFSTYFRRFSQQVAYAFMVLAFHTLSHEVQRSGGPENPKTPQKKNFYDCFFLAMLIKGEGSLRTNQ